MKKKKLLLIAMISLVTFGFGKTVKAESYIADSAPDKFLTNKVGHQYENGQLTEPQNDSVLSNTTVSAAGQNVIDYHTKDMKKIFCLDRTKQYPITGDVEYTKINTTFAYGIVYIIVNSEKYYNSLDLSGVSDTNKKMEQSWFTQIAIWRFQNSDFANLASKTGFSNDIFEEGVQVPGTTIDDYYYYSRRAKQLWDATDSLVRDANNATNIANETISVSYDGNNSIDKDSKTVKTNVITVDKTNIKSYKLDISKAPNGTKVYSENGAEITDLGTITVDKFYLVFPIDNVDNYTYDFNLGISTDNYVSYDGHFYTSGDVNQPVVLVTKGNKSASASLNLKGSHVEDTASSIANSIYFVGFLILITGIGIIYANVKTKKEEV